MRKANNYKIKASVNNTPLETDIEQIEKIPAYLQEKINVKTVMEQESDRENFTGRYAGNEQIILKPLNIKQIP